MKFFHSKLVAGLIALVTLVSTPAGLAVNAHVTPVLTNVASAPQVQAAAAVDDGDLDLLVLGDSISTSGQWIQELCRLAAQDAGITCDIHNASVSGVKCNYFLSRIAALLNQFHPDMVILACGTNDANPANGFSPNDTGTAFRILVETIYTFQTPRIKIVPSLIQYSDPAVWGSTQLNNEATINDTLYVNMQYYLPSGWFGTPAMVVDWQAVPNTPDYLVPPPTEVPGGIHPNARGHKAYGRLAYDRIAPGMGWPASSEPALCGMWGRRFGYPVQPFIQCAPYVAA